MLQRKRRENSDHWEVRQGLTAIVILIGHSKPRKHWHRPFGAEEAVDEWHWAVPLQRLACSGLLCRLRFEWRRCGNDGWEIGRLPRRCIPLESKTGPRGVQEDKQNKQAYKNSKIAIDQIAIATRWRAHSISIRWLIAGTCSNLPVTVLVCCWTERKRQRERSACIRSGQAAEVWVSFCSKKRGNQALNFPLVKPH